MLNLVKKREGFMLFFTKNKHIAKYIILFFVEGVDVVF